MVNNISHESPCFLGFAPDKHLPQGRRRACSSTSTCRGSRATSQANERPFWAHIDVDVLKAALADVDLPGNLRLQGDSGAHPRTACRGAEGEGDAAHSARPRSARVARLTAERDASASHRAAELAADKGKPDAINPHYLLRGARQAARRPRTSSSTRRSRNTPAVLMQIDRAAAGHDHARRRRRPGLVRRHGARRQARARRSG